MKEYGIGMMARSLAGHDRGKMYMILSQYEQYVYLSYGVYRTVGKLKKKKKKHIQIDCRIPEEIQKLLDEGRPIQNSDVIRARREYGNKNRE